METLITKLNAFLSKLYPSWLEGVIAEDKFMHALCGFVIALVLTPFVGATSLVAVGILAALKEGYDYMNKAIHTSDLMDWVATVLGGLVGFVIVALV